MLRSLLFHPPSRPEHKNTKSFQYTPSGISYQVHRSSDPDQHHWILFSHGNATDLLHMSLQECFSPFNWIAWDFPGYGYSSGEASSDSLLSGMREWMDDLFHHFETEWTETHATLELVGHSIGTPVTLYGATQAWTQLPRCQQKMWSKHLERVTLISPMTSVGQVARDLLGQMAPGLDAFGYICPDVFSLKGWMEYTHEPHLQAFTHWELRLIHGQDDSLIHSSHSLQLSDACGLNEARKSCIVLPHLGHNELQELWTRGQKGQRREQKGLRASDSNYSNSNEHNEQNDGQNDRQNYGHLLLWLCVLLAALFSWFRRSTFALTVLGIIFLIGIVIRVWISCVM